MSRRFRVESQDPGSRLLGRMLPSMRPGDELVLVGRFGSFVVPPGLGVIAAGAAVERAEVSDAEIAGGTWSRLHVTGRAVLKEARVDLLAQPTGDLSLWGVDVASGQVAGRLVAHDSALGVVVDGVAELHDVRGDIVVNGAVKGSRVSGTLRCAGRVQLERFTGVLVMTAGSLEVADVDLDGGDGPCITLRGGEMFLDAGRLRGAVDAPAGALVLGAAVVRS